MAEQKKEKSAAEPSNDATKPSGQDVGPPENRVDDETDAEESKTTQRQE